MLLHYLSFHKAVDKDPLNLLDRSKGSFSVPVDKNWSVKDVETNPSVVYIDQELQVIIDYKDSLIETEDLFGYKVELNDDIEAEPVVTSKHVSKRFCGNLTVSRQDKSIPNILGSNKTAPKQQNQSETRFTTDSKFNSRPVISNLNQPVQSITDSENEQNSLLIKRNEDTWTKKARKGSTDVENSNKKVKRQGLRSADKKVSRRCMNLG